MMETTKSLLLKYAAFAVFIILAAGGMVLLTMALFKGDEEKIAQNQTDLKNGIEQVDEELTDAEIAGRKLNYGNCDGIGPVELTHSPMDLEDFTHIIPYGMTIGSHVTPIDHQYFSPASYDSPVDAYEVYALADGKIVEIGTRDNTDNEGKVLGKEYRIVFAHTCTFHTYFDLVTQLAQEIEVEFIKNERNGYAGNLNIEVEAGQLIGRIGGQTLDFAVWDTEKPLTGFVQPESYEMETWKIYTADPYEYYMKELKEILTEKNVRTAEPIAGKIDHDIDGRLIGNWFEEGTNGYAGTNQSAYYSGHLSIAPDHIDPTHFIVSMGNYDGQPGQFATKTNEPNPAEVSVETGMVKYILTDYGYVDADGNNLGRSPMVQGGIIAPFATRGVVLVQMLENRKIMFEAFPDASETEELIFTEEARIYIR